MALPATRAQLAEWCLRKLGAGVVKINVSPRQVEDRIDETIERFQEHHFDGVQRVHLKHKVTQEDKDNGYLPTTDAVISVTSIAMPSGILGGSLFSFGFQQALQALPVWPGGSLQYYFQMRQNLRLVEQLFIGEKVITFNRMMNRLYIDIDWKGGILVDDYIIIEAYLALNPETFKKVYSNHFVREYATALIEQQWGQNLGKFRNVKLPGGAVLNGDQMYERGTKKLEALEKRLKDEFQVPPGFFVG